MTLVTFINRLWLIVRDSYVKPRAVDISRIAAGCAAAACIARHVDVAAERCLVVCVGDGDIIRVRYLCVPARPGVDAVERAWPGVAYSIVAGRVGRIRLLLTIR